MEIDLLNARHHTSHKTLVALYVHTCWTNCNMRCANKQDVPAKIVEDALGFKLRRYMETLEANWDIMMLGYCYQKGERGRGNTAKFVSDYNN